METIRKDSQDSERAHNEKLLLHQIALSEKLKTLERRNEEMKEAEKYMRQKNEAERQQFEKEKQEVGSPSSSGFGSYNFLHPGNNNLQGRQNVFLQFLEVNSFLNSSRQVSRFHMIQGNCLDFFKSDFCEVFEVLLASSAFFS